MTTFNPSITPSFGSDYEINPLVDEVRFGDGYVQRVGTGVKEREEKVNLVWNNISGTAKDELRTFFDSQKSGTVFQWQNFDGVTKNYYYKDSYKISPTGYNSYTFSISLIETSDS